LRKERTRRCVPAEGTSGTAQPVMLSVGDEETDYFPASAQRRGEAGTAQVLVRVSAQGCPLHATLLVPTGSVSLDHASLNVVLDSTFLPAEVNGRPIEADYTFRALWGFTSRRPASPPQIQFRLPRLPF
jgi:TonB family protein